MAVPPPSPDRDLYEARIRAVYEEAGRAADHFLEWRHKVILLCSTTVALTFAAASYIYKTHLGDVPMIIAVLLAAAVMFQCVRFDRRNAWLLNGASYATAQECETKLRRPPGQLSDVPVGVWTRINTTRGVRVPFKAPPGTYTGMLRRMYQALGIGFVACAVAVAVFHVPTVATPIRTSRLTLRSGGQLCGEVLSTKALVGGRVAVAIAVDGSGVVRLIPLKKLKTFTRSEC